MSTHSNDIDMSQCVQVFTYSSSYQHQRLGEQHGGHVKCAPHLRTCSLFPTVND